MCCAAILHACQCHVGAMPKLSQHPARYPCHQPGLCDWWCYQTIYDDTRNKLDGPTLSLSFSSFIRDWEIKPATNNKSSKQPRGQAKQSQRMQIALMHAWQGKKRNQRLSKTQHTLTIIMNGPNPQCPTTTTRFPLFSLRVCLECGHFFFVCSCVFSVKIN